MQKQKIILGLAGVAIIAVAAIALPLTTRRDVQREESIRYLYTGSGTTQASAPQPPASTASESSSITSNKGSGNLIQLAIDGFTEHFDLEKLDIELTEEFSSFSYDTSDNTMSISWYSDIWSEELYFTASFTGVDPEQTTGTLDALYAHGKGLDVLAPELKKEAEASFAGLLGMQIPEDLTLSTSIYIYSSTRTVSFAWEKQHEEDILDLGTPYYLAGFDNVDSEFSSGTLETLIRGRWTDSRAEYTEEEIPALREQAEQFANTLPYEIDSYAGYRANELAFAFSLKKGSDYTMLLVEYDDTLSITGFYLLPYGYEYLQQ